MSKLTYSFYVESGRVGSSAKFSQMAQGLSLKLQSSFETCLTLHLNYVKSEFAFSMNA
jgi:hypothetical protein